MAHTMPGQPNRLKSRKRKTSSGVKSTRKHHRASTRRSMKSPGMRLAGESGPAVSGSSKAGGLVRHPVTRKRGQSASRKKCSASSALVEREGKENELRMELDLDSCKVNVTLEEQDPGKIEFEDMGKNMFPDDDSNQILPVEQFFGNLEVAQDFPQRPSTTSGCFQRERRQRRHFYAREDSNKEDHGSTQGD
ncbi:UPF0688 protein C1orf174 homolog [Brachionichthys hirsutus]|uniref:UPF0688 protein C1orf174 homolog n=1 Tax=Brachionichthys hirsutus TaxID=412623 RepID=UPI003604FF36